MATYEDVLIAIADLDYAAQLQIAMHILSNLNEMMQPDDEDVEQEEFRKTLPKLTDLYREGYVKAGDVVYLVPKKKQYFRDQFAVLQDDDTVQFKNEMMSINEWARRVYETKGVNIYLKVVVDRVQRTLGDLRNEYIARFGLKEVAENL